MKRMVGDPQFRRQAPFVLGNLVACAVIVAVIVMPIYSFFSDRDDRIEERGKVLARLTAVASQAANVQSIVSDTKEQMQGGEFLVGPNENVINADLQTKLRTMTESAG